MVLIAAYLSAMYVYTLQNIENDYHFIYGTPLKQFWILSIKAVSLIIISCFSLMIFKQFEMIPTTTDGYVELITYCVGGLILAPIPIYVLYIYVKYQTSSKKFFIINKTPNWGPPKPEQRQARKRFNPQREMHYKSDTARCKHNCLLNSNKIKDEIERLNENRQILMDTVDEETMNQLQERQDLSQQDN